MPQVDGRTKDALAAAETTHDHVRIPTQLDPDLWKSVSKVLITLGGAYQLNRSAFAFTFDPRPTIQQIVRTGQYVNPVADEGYVPTPDELAEELTTHPYSDLGRMPAGSRVLDPSAGEGALVRAILDANNVVEVVAVEPNPDRAALIADHRDRGTVALTVVPTTFEEYAAAHAGELFDAVVMNPPFAVPGSPDLWIDHVMTAWNLLEPGGRLAAIVPAGLTYRTGKRHTDLRQLATDFGGWRKLPPNTFDRGVQVCVLWLTRPVPGQEGRPSYLFRHYPDAVDPVPVTEPWLTTRAVREAPVQVWRDNWRSTERVLRYRAQCWGCGWLLWSFDGDNDMSLGQHSACTSLNAEEYDKVGLSVGLCVTCANTGETYADAMKVAHTVWAKPPGRAAAVSVWSALLNRGGMIPVDDLERERYARVQAAMRDVFGVPEHAPEPELIEARQAKPWRGGPDRLAAKYLTEYADRLDPDADLDDADRAAMLWRTDPDAPPVSLAEEPSPWTAVLEQLEIPLGV